MSKLNAVLPSSISELYEHHQTNTCRAIGLKEPVMVYRFNEQLSIWYSVVSMPFPFQPRDFLLLQYTEILPEDNFAIVASTSIDLPIDHPVLAKLKFEPGAVRGEITAGFILRAGPQPGTTNFTQIKHLDLGGSMTNKLPTSFIKKQVLSKQKKVFMSHYDWSIQVSEEKKRLSEKPAVPQDSKRQSTSLQTSPSPSIELRETISAQ